MRDAFFCSAQYSLIFVSDLLDPGRPGRAHFILSRMLVLAGLLVLTNNGLRTFNSQFYVPPA